jgi:beta-glucanase (GH16 family)
MELINLAWDMAYAVRFADRLDVGWQTSLPVSGWKPGETHKVVAELRNATLSGSCTVAVEFRAADGGIVRNFVRTVRGNQRQRVEIVFAAPNFTQSARIVVQTFGNRADLYSVSTEAAPPRAQTEPTIWNKASAVPAGRRLAFNDEFEGTALDRDKWHTRFIYEDGKKDHLITELQRYTDLHQVSGGVLKIQPRRRADGLWDSGMIRSDRTFLYGFFEARVRLPKGRGVFPAMWLNPDVSSDGRLEWPPEIDVFEYVNDGATDKPNMVHAGVIPHDEQRTRLLDSKRGWDEPNMAWHTQEDQTDAWHTVGLDWLPDRVVHYWDGQHTHTRELDWRRADGHPAAPAHLIINYAVGGGWAGRNGVDDKLGPLEINYVRCYK